MWLFASVWENIGVGMVFLRGAEIERPNPYGGPGNNT